VKVFPKDYKKVLAKASLIPKGQLNP
jgi:hypothetical protein